MRPHRWNPEKYARNARFVAEFGRSVVELLAARPGERILDLGCGDGTLMRHLADAGADVVGVDASPEMVAAAAARGLNVGIMDGAALTFDAEFDAVFSNAAIHWMGDLDGVVAGVWRALKPGGRFVAEMGGKGNVGAVRRALKAALVRRGVSTDHVCPWVFPTADAFGGLLRKHGFRITALRLFPRPTPVDGTIEDWLEVFGASFVEPLTPEQRPAFLAEVAEALAPELKTSDGQWVVDYVRLRFSAIKPKEVA